MHFDNETLDTALETVCTRFRDTPALLIDGRTITFTDLLAHSRDCAERLRGIGIRKNDRVAILLSNSAEYLYLYFACFTIGAWAVPISTRWERDELRNVLIDASVKAIVFEPKIGTINYEAILRDIRRELPTCSHFVGTTASDITTLLFEELFVPADPGDRSDDRHEAVSPDDVALLAYTSGTTGTPKGVMIPHRSLVLTSRHTGVLWDLGPGEVAFSVAPLYAAQGFLAVLIDLVTGVTMKWNTSFNPQDIIREFSRGGITCFHTQPTMWSLLLAQPAFNFVDFSNLKKVIVSGSLCTHELARRIEERVGCTVLNAYGLIEATGVVTVTRPGDSEEIRLGSVGYPIPGAEYRIVDEKRNDVAPGETGELAVRGYLMKGYYNRPEKTAEVIDADGWLYTGDLATRGSDDGAVRIVGRCKDMIIRGGFNVYPVDIEECILRNECVDDVAVVGKPDDLLGESISAFVIPKPGVLLTEGDIKRFCRGKIANYKIPDDVHIVSQLPILISGKVQKNVLREWVCNGIPEENLVLFGSPTPF